MFTFIKPQKRKFLFSTITKLFVFVLSFSLIFAPTAGYAQNINLLNLPAPGTMIAPSNVFYPVLVKGIEIHPQNPLMFDFIMDTGDTNLSEEEFHKESSKLIKYFLAALTVPEEEMWVNLSPYEENRIIPGSFGQTEMGRDLLAQDYILKQLAASLMYPEEDIGRKFWKRVYKQAEARYGSVDIPMNTFNKVWIVPESVSVYEYDKGAFVVDSHLKVMLEEDYLALAMNQNSTKHGLGNIIKDDLDVVTGITAEVVREVLIPEIEREVNEGKHFANLRQIYNAMILATWYKQRLNDSLLGQVYADQKKIEGIKISDKQANQKIYERYVKAFKKGVYNYIKEDYDPASQTTIPRKYFSGGAAARGLTKNLALLSGAELQAAKSSASPIGEARRVAAGVEGVFGDGQEGAAASPVNRIDELARASWRFYDGGYVDTLKIAAELGISRHTVEERLRRYGGYRGSGSFMHLERYPEDPQEREERDRVQRRRWRQPKTNVIGDPTAHILAKVREIGVIQVSQEVTFRDRPTTIYLNDKGTWAIDLDGTRRSLEISQGTPSMFKILGSGSNEELGPYFDHRDLNISLSKLQEGLEAKITQERNARLVQELESEIEAVEFLLGNLTSARENPSVVSARYDLQFASHFRLGPFNITGQFLTLLNLEQGNLHIASGEVAGTSNNETYNRAYQLLKALHSELFFEYDAERQYPTQLGYTIYPETLLLDDYKSTGIYPANRKDTMDDKPRVLRLGMELKGLDPMEVLRQFQDALGEILKAYLTDYQTAVSLSGVSLESSAQISDNTIAIFDDGGNVWSEILTTAPPRGLSVAVSQKEEISRTHTRKVAK